MSAIVDPSAARRGIWLVCFASILWGTVGIATQTVYHQSNLSALGVGFWRLAFAWPVVALLGRLIIARPAEALDRPQLLRMLAIGAMLALYQVCYFSAISQVGVAIATLITLCSAPAIVALLSVWWLGERLTRPTLLALVCALAGTCLLVGTPQPLGEQVRLLLGAALALGSATGYAIVTLLGKNLATQVHPLRSAGISFAAGALCLLPFAAAAGLTSAQPLPVWALLGYIGLVPTALAYLCFFLAMRQVPASTASILTLLEPLTATLLAWWLFDERLGPGGALGALLLLGAIGILYRGTRN
jgi:drug/metabolite transporter, DME family